MNNITFQKLRAADFEYFSHIAGVVSEIRNAFEKTPEMEGTLALTCALLYDTLEDTP
ncbi:hypothetical protein [Sphingobacterium sp. 18053]|uniref:hypothetical protein n=1 Tax=Sphingobacterium sp. 18053 TaxID=2681401 RepID=UPI00135862F8|nr:hypothetical protein [Sphingobacterium sp. 18053]